MCPTFKNHFNPCFWTAYWNEDYFIDSVRGNKKDPRKQVVYSLIFNANKVVKTITERVHFGIKLGFAELPSDVRNADNESKYAIDVENLFSKLEEITSRPLKDIIHKESIDTKEDKLAISHFLFFQHAKSLSVLSNMFKEANKQNIPKYRCFVLLKEMLSNTKFLMSRIWPLFQARWILYKCDRHTFPLSDKAILNNETNILFPISPRMLLNIIPSIIDLNICHVINDVPNEVYLQFMRRSINMSSQEIIFSDKTVLNKWRESKLFRRRRKLLLGKQA